MESLRRYSKRAGPNVTVIPDPVTKLTPPGGGTARALDQDSPRLTTRAAYFVSVRFGRFAFLLWLGLQFLGSAAWAVPRSATGPDALRQLAKCPQVDLQVAFGVDSARGFVINDPERPSAEVTSARSALKVSEDNPREWLRLGTWLPSTGDTNGAAAALRRAVQQFRSRVERNPADDESQSGLADALNLEGHADEAERGLRGVVETQPNAWRSRLALAQLLDVHWMSATRREGSSAERKAAEAEKPMQQEEAGRLIERAVALAPEEPRVYRARGLHRLSLAQVAAASAEGAEAADVTSRGARTAIDDYWKSATLWRTNVLSWGVAAFTELVSCVGPRAADGVEFATLPLESQQRLVGALRALESMVSDEAPARSAVALEMRGMLQFLTGSRAAAESTLKRAVKLDAGRFQAWEVLLALYIRGEDRAGLLETCEARVQARSNPRNHLLLAKALERSGKYPEALEAAEAGVAKFPESLWLQLAAVCLSLRTSTDAASLEGVPPLLKDITARLDKMPRNAEWGAIIQHFVPTLCLYHALAGNADEARRVLKEWVKSNPEDAWARQILDAVGV